jgi:hypothetical protein
MDDFYPIGESHEKGTALTSPSRKRWQKEFLSMERHEYKGEDIYVHAVLAPSTARNGSKKLLRFWLYPWLKVQGYVQIPKLSKDGDIFQIPRNDFWKYFTKQGIREHMFDSSAYSWMTNGDPVSLFFSDEVQPRGDLYIVIHTTSTPPTSNRNY